MMNIVRKLPGGHGGGRGGNEDQAAGIAMAERRAAVATAPSLTGHPGRAATLAGENAGAGGMTMATANRWGRGCGQISTRQNQHGPGNQGQYQVRRYGGPFHYKFMISGAYLENKGVHNLVLAEATNLKAVLQSQDERQDHGAAFQQLEEELTQGFTDLGLNFQPVLGGFS
jgi:hypothetical protein